MMYREFLKNKVDFDLFDNFFEILRKILFSFGAMERQQAELEKQKAIAQAKQAQAEKEAELKRQKKQAAIDAKLYTEKSKFFKKSVILGCF